MVVAEVEEEGLEPETEPLPEPDPGLELDPEPELEAEPEPEPVSDAGSSASSPQSHRPPARPSANSNSCSALNEGRSGNRRPYIAGLIGPSIGRCVRAGERH